MVLQESVARKAVEFVKNNKGKLLLGALGAGAAYAGVKAIEHGYDQKIDKLEPEVNAHKQAAEQLGKEADKEFMMGRKHALATSHDYQMAWNNVADGNVARSKMYDTQLGKDVNAADQHMDKFDKLNKQYKNEEAEASKLKNKVDDLKYYKNRTDEFKGVPIAAAGILGAAAGHYLLDRKSKKKGN